MRNLIFGDSHCHFFEISEELRSFNFTLLGVNNFVVKIPGATINGFGKRKSTLNVKDVFLENYKRVDPDNVCFSLGQVDIELGYFFKTIVNEEKLDFKKFSTELVDTYLNTISSIFEGVDSIDGKIIIKGVNLPVIVYGRKKAVNYTSRIISENISDRKEVLKLRSEMSKSFPSGLERNKNHILFNEILKEKSRSFGFKYFDINAELKSNSSNLISPAFVPSASDHHLVDSIYVRNLHSDSLVKVILCDM